MEDAIPGVPGDDYPIFAEVPETSFLCDGQADGGYYADPEAQCQAFHICANDGQGGRTKFSFLCPNGTLFQQQYFVCDWWFNVDCSLAESFYGLNDQIAAERDAISAAGPAAGSTQGAGRQGATGGQRGNSAQSSLGGDGEGAASGGGGSTGGAKSSGSSASKSGSKSSSAGKGGASKGQSGGGRRGGPGVSAAASATQNTYASPASFGGQAGGNYGAPANGFGGGDFGFGFGGETGGSLGSYARAARDLEADHQLLEGHHHLEEDEEHHMADEQEDQE